MTLDLRARSTERLLGGLALVAVGVASALAPLQSGLFLLAAPVICLGLWRQGWLGGKRRLTAISWLPDGHWLLSDARQASIPADLRADSRVGGSWLWLRWTTDCSLRPRRRSLLLLGGDIPNSDLRRLVVRLKLEAQLAGVAGASKRQRTHVETSGA
jgi:hypothetical protein